MEINFIFQVNSFHRFKRENPLSANAQALWVELFGLFNARLFCLRERGGDMREDAAFHRHTRLKQDA